MPLPIVPTPNCGGGIPNNGIEEDAITSELEENKQAEITTNNNPSLTTAVAIHPSIRCLSANSPQTMTMTGMHQAIHPVPPQLKEYGPTVPDVLKCGVKSCKKFDVKTDPVKQCSHEGCKRLVHKECYNLYVLKKHVDLQCIGAGILFAQRHVIRHTSKIKRVDSVGRPMVRTAIRILTTRSISW